MATSQVTGSPAFFAARTRATPSCVDSRARCTCTPVARTSSKIASSAIVSAKPGIAGKPRRVATSPSCATPPRARWTSCGRNQTRYPKVAAYCSARSSTCVSARAASACENATQPASASSPISVIVSPFKPTVSAPIGYTCAWLSERARCLSIWTSPGSSSGGSVSITGPVLIPIFPLIAGGDTHHRPAHRDAESHLRQDHRMRSVGDRRIDLHAAVHRSRMHDDRVGLGELELLDGQSVMLEEFAGGRQERALHALALQAQHDDDVATLEALAHVVEHVDAKRLYSGGKQRLRADHAY